jgi:hypothetical protein
MQILMAILPNGKIIERKTNHAYTYITAIRFTHFSKKFAGGILGEWGATWHATYSGAKASASHFQNCVAVQLGEIIKVETQIIPLCNGNGHQPVATIATNDWAGSGPCEGEKKV